MAVLVAVQAHYVGVFNQVEKGKRRMKQRGPVGATMQNKKRGRRVPQISKVTKSVPAPQEKKTGWRRPELPDVSESGRGRWKLFSEEPPIRGRSADQDTEQPDEYLETDGRPDSAHYADQRDDSAVFQENS